MQKVAMVRAGLAQMGLLAALSVVPANALVITSISINGVQLVSEAESTTWGLPASLNISRNNGSFLFNIALASDPSQNPNESTLGDSFAVSFFSNPGNPLPIPANYQSPIYFTGPTSVSFTRTFSTDGIFDGGLSILMSNSVSTYRSFFSGYEAKPVFHFDLFNNGVTTLSTSGAGPGTGGVTGAGTGPALTPEPSTFCLMLGGGLLLAKFGRRGTAGQ